MKVGVPTEIKTDEYRVSLTPAGVRELVEQRARGADPVRRGRGKHDPRRGVRGAGRAHAAGRAVGVRRGRDGPRGEGAAAAGGGDAAAGPPAVHLPASRAGSRPDQGARGVGGDLRGLRDGRGRAGPPAAARADERGGREDRHAGRRVLPRASARRARRAARRSAGRGGRDRDDHRRRRGGPERGVHRDRHGGRRVRLRPQHRPPARARRGLRRPGVDGLLVDARRRGDAPAGGPRDRRGAGPRRPRAVRREARPARPHEEARRAGGRVDRPGRLLRDLEADHAQRPGLRSGRRDALLRREHAGRRARHVHVRAHERHPAVRPRTGRPRPRGGDPKAARTGSRRERRGP